MDDIHQVELFNAGVAVSSVTSDCQQEASCTATELRYERALVRVNCLGR